MYRTLKNHLQNSSKSRYQTWLTTCCH